MPQYLSPGVYVEERPSGSKPIEGVGTAVAAFVGMAAEGPFNAPTLVTNWTQYLNTFGEPLANGYLGQAVYGYFNNGGGSAYIVRIGRETNGAAALPQAATGALESGSSEGQIAYDVKAVEGGVAGNDITVEVSDASEGDQSETFKLEVKRSGQVVETFDNLSTKRGKTHVATVVNDQSKLVRIEEQSGLAVADRRPAAGASVQLSGGSATPAPTGIAPDDYVGDPADRTGFGGLETVDAVTMVSVPDLMAAYQHGLIDGDGVKAVQLALIAHCEQMGDRMAVLDPPPGLNPQQVSEWRVDKAGYDSKHAALYWPWITVHDPARGKAVDIPPSGHLAGVWARSDAERGVHKAPANEVIRGALGPACDLTRGEHDLLNPDGINCIRSFPGRGVRVWGARTLSSDPEWRYVNVRRLFNFIEESILDGTQWVVFEPNDLDLWQRIRRTVNAFLLNQWRQGALFGATPEQAFYVKCDEETNPPELVDAGQVTVEIGICPVKPAEFVVFRLQQLATGGAVSE